jgi:hypothetical protein
MKILHILRSEPSDLVRRFIAAMSRGEGTREFPLHRGAVDYDELVREIFQSDRVICWW